MNTFHLLIALAIFVVVYIVSSSFVYQRRTNALEKQWKCGKPLYYASFPRSLWHFYVFLRESRKHKLLEGFQSSFEAKKPFLTNKVNIFGKDIFNTCDPENLKAMLATQFKDFCLGERHAQLFPVLGDGIFTLDGNGWQHSRAMLRPQFARDQVSDVHMVETHLQFLVSRVNGSKPVDMQELFFNLTLDTATEFLFGQSVGCQIAESDPGAYSSDMPLDLRKSFQKDFNKAQEHLGERVRLQMLYWLWNPKELKTAGARVHAFVDHYVSKALVESEEKVDDDKYVFLRELARETKEPKVLRDQALNILLAGRDTTASLLSWCIYLMARDDRVWQKLRSEVIEQFGDGENLENITFESLKRCDYLRYVLNEALRLYPSVPANMRFATKDTTLPRGGGPVGQDPIVIRKGNVISYHVFTTHRLTQYWGEDAEEFVPERWAEGKARGWEYLPFNGGPRICLGQQYALTEAGYVLVRLAQMFDTLENADDKPEPPVKQHALTMSHLTGVHVKLYKKQR